MRKNTLEKQQLLKRISDQAETIHQLTHHMHILQAKANEEAIKSENDISIKNSNKFGGSYPIFYKDQNVEVDRLLNSQNSGRFQNKSLNSGKDLNYSQVSKPWPLSDTIHDQSERSQSINRIMNEGQHSNQPYDKSFISRMTDGINNNSSSYASNEQVQIPLQSQTHEPSFSQRNISNIHHSTTTSLPSASVSMSATPPFMTPKEFPFRTTVIQTDKTVQVI